MAAVEAAVVAGGFALISMGLLVSAYMLALSIRQPYAELILRGVKTIEYRSRPTRIIGLRFYIYAARTPGPTVPRHRLPPTPVGGTGPNFPSPRIRVIPILETENL